MTIVTREEAEGFFFSLPDELRFAHYSPGYVCADALRDNALTPMFFLYRQKDDFFYHAFHLAKVPDSDFYDIQSPYGYGGALIHASDPKTADKAWAEYTDWCREQRVLVEFIRFHPALKNYVYYHGETFFDRQVVWIDPAIEAPFEGYNAKTRTAVRKALKSGIGVGLAAPEDFLRHFRPLYRETMRHAGATEFYDFTDAYFAEIASLSANRMLCFHEGRAISGAIYLTSGVNMESHLTASNDAGRDLRAGHLIIHEMKRLGTESGCRFLHLGGGTDGSADNRLLSFKKNFSERLEDFYIGKRVFFEAPYRSLKEDWEKRTGTSARRVLFYR
jgi:hypothetical protein